MLRTALTASLRPGPSSRSFVSTVLLTRNWEKETLSSLRKEAKLRGLLQAGNKATLITRLQEHEQQRQYEVSVPPSPVQQQQVRRASTAEVPGIPSTSQPTSIPPSYPQNLLDVKIPSADYPVPEILAQIPFVPDLWESSRIKAESAPPKPQEPSVPKVLAIGGAATHYGGGLSHNLYPGPSGPTTEQPDSGEQSFWRDVADDLLLPRSFKLSVQDVPKELLEGLAETTSTSDGSTSKHYSRPLDEDEKRGVWMLLGLFASSWLVAGILKAEPAFSGTTESAEGETVPEQH